MINEMVLLLFFHGIKVEVLGQVSGYVGDTITLPSNANRSWVLSRIDWSIFTNNTWIATFDNNVTNVDRRPEYKGRLNLEKQSGSLTIKNLSQSDAMEYTVDLLNNKNENKVNKIRLTVKQHLQKPTVMEIDSGLRKTGCIGVLNCSSPENGVDFAWEVTPSCPYYINISGSGVSKIAVFLQKAPHSVNATCTVRREKEKASRTFKITCPSPEIQSSNRERCGLLFLGGCICGVFIGILLSLYFTEKILPAVRQHRGKQISPSKA